MNAPLHIRDCRPEDVRRVILAAGRDGHKALPPTHVWERSGQMVAYASVGGVCLIGGWADRAQMNDAEARAAFEHSISIARQAGERVVATACTDDCRFKPFMADAGFKPSPHPITLYLKLL